MEIPRRAACRDCARLDDDDPVERGAQPFAAFVRVHVADHHAVGDAAQSLSGSTAPGGTTISSGLPSMTAAPSSTAKLTSKSQSALRMPQ